MKSFATVIVGHRGVGKSALLRQLASPLSEVAAGPTAFYDLDQEIQNRTGQKIAELLAQGESEFREIEQNVLKELVEKASSTGTATLITAGAGIEKVPEQAHVVWLRRSTDEAGRVFTDRPRLNVKVSPYTEYNERFAVRQERYRGWAHEELWIPEGYEKGIEEFFAPRQDWLLPYELTLLPWNFRDWPSFWNKRRNWSLRHVEIRDDILSEANLAVALKEIPAEHIIYAHRKANYKYSKILSKFKVLFDWPLELGTPPEEAGIVSLHERLGPMISVITALTRATQGRKVIAKLSVQVEKFEDLEAGHRWWLEDPERRAFMPCSLDGRWQWYRALYGRKMPLHFFREGDGSSPDQPYLWQTLFQPVMNKQFAAVLGHPVSHSRSPVEHHDFFREFGTPVVAIPVPEQEWSSAMLMLARMGMTFAAVTAPLKEKAAALVGHKEPVNTIWLAKDGKFRGANTDGPALKSMADEYRDHKRVWLWGAGAMRSNVVQAFPDVTVISARAGSAVASTPELLIWATGRSRIFKWPGESVKPKMVLDLNYSDDSPGLEFAVANNLTYQSGLRLFKLQAELQRQHWREALESK